VALNRPVRYNPVTVKFVRIEPTNTQWDEDYKEAIGGNPAYGSEIEFQCQVNFGQKEYFRRQRTERGEARPSYGWLTFKMKYWEDNSVNLKKGDRITGVAGQAADFEIMEVRPESPLRGGFLLMYVEFTKRGV